MARIAAMTLRGIGADRSGELRPVLIVCLAEDGEEGVADLICVGHDGDFLF